MIFINFLDEDLKNLTQKLKNNIKVYFFLRTMIISFCENSKVTLVIKDTLLFYGVDKNVKRAFPSK